MIVPNKDLFTLSGLQKWKCICSVLLKDTITFDKGEKRFNIVHIKPNQVPNGKFIVLKYLDTENECKSFESYICTRLVTFLICAGICGETLTEELFRFVPDPGSFDHIFDDEELYRKYSITSEEIKIIELGIK